MAGVVETDRTRGREYIQGGRKGRRKGRRKREKDKRTKCTTAYKVEGDNVDDSVATHNVHNSEERGMRRRTESECPLVTLDAGVDRNLIHIQSPHRDFPRLMPGNCRHCHLQCRPCRYHC